MAVGRLIIALLAAAVNPSAVMAQMLFTYTEEPADGNIFALGFPPPIPVDSATPVEGFRSYDGLHARHQDLMLQHEFIAGEIVGETTAGREIWAYVLGDPGRETENAGPESSALVCGALHAREWGAPELTTALIEAHAAGAGDRHLYDFLTDNVSLVVLPMGNIDGLLQTQRFPTEVFVGRDPRFPESWPRDGRMRRKNMRGVDEDLFSLADHLLGVDLNRNSPPFWATSNASSRDPDSLVHHGQMEFSEPELVALLAAAELAGTPRLRWYEDVHSFTQKFFSPRTFKTSRNQAQDRLLGGFIEFHDALSKERRGRGRRYTNQPKSTGAGIGTTAEYFAYTHEIPSWTLEIEPSEAGAVDYGGLGTEHDGFIMPDSQVARFREDMATAHAFMAYRQAGPPSVATVEIRDDHGETTFIAHWRYAGGNERALDVDSGEPLLAGTDYTLRVVFDKPMRWQGETGPRIAPGLEVPFKPVIVIGHGVADAFEIETVAGRWLGRPGQAEAFANYRYDTFEVEFRVPRDFATAGGPVRVLSIEAEDFAGQALDANPATVADWRGGEWVGYEGVDGFFTGPGGPDRTLSLRAAGRRESRMWFLRRGR